MTRMASWASGPDAFGDRRVLPATTGAGVQVEAGTCPGCGDASHRGTTCRGLTTRDVYAILRRSPRCVYVPLDDRR